MTHIRIFECLVPNGTPIKIGLGTRVLRELFKRALRGYCGVRGREQL
jgi:hypothetical protein